MEIALLTCKLYGGCLYSSQLNFLRRSWVCAAVWTAGIVVKKDDTQWQHSSSFVLHCSSMTVWRVLQFAEVTVIPYSLNSVNKTPPQSQTNVAVSFLVIFAWIFPICMATCYTSNVWIALSSQHFDTVPISFIILSTNSPSSWQVPFHPFQGGGHSLRLVFSEQFQYSLCTNFVAVKLHSYTIIKNWTWHLRNMVNNSE